MKGERCTQYYARALFIVRCIHYRVEDSDSDEQLEQQSYSCGQVAPGEGRGDNQQEVEMSQIGSSQQPVVESGCRKMLEMSKILNTAYNKLPGFSTSSSSVRGAGSGQLVAVIQEVIPGRGDRTRRPASGRDCKAERQHQCRGRGRGEDKGRVR